MVRYTLSYRKPHNNSETCISTITCINYQTVCHCIIGVSLSEPHIDEMNVCNLYMNNILLLWWHIRHPRAAIDIVQPCTIYSKDRMKTLQICTSSTTIPLVLEIVDNTKRIPMLELATGARC